MKCIGCGVTIEKDEEASWWMKYPIYHDPNVLDYDNDGRACDETESGVHEIEDPCVRL